MSKSFFRNDSRVKSNPNEPLLPTNTYDNINCRYSTKFFVSVTFCCVHNIGKGIDIYKNFYY